MKYCRMCLTTNLRPNADFDENDICIACRYSHHKLNPIAKNDIRLEGLIDWLKELAARRGKKSFNKYYDCIVGVSGGKDSSRQAHWVRDRLGLNPLLICGAYPPLQSTQIGSKNLSNLISKGFDLEVHTPSPRTSASLVLSSFEKYGNVSKPTEMALSSIVPKIAIEKKIPLIFWGENPATQVGDSKVMGENVYDGNNLRNMNTLDIEGYEWVVNKVGSRKSVFYQYPDIAQMKKSAVSIVYLGPAWDDWSNYDNSEYASLNGLELRPDDTNITGDISGASMLDEEFTNINMMIKFYKFGFGRTNDHVSEMIRSGRVSREEGIKIVEEYDGVCHESIILRFCKYTNIELDYFWNIVNQFVNPSLFEIRDGDRPLKKFLVGEDLG